MTRISKIRDSGQMTSMSYQTETVGTLQYMAPESMQSSYYSSATDVYAFGVVAWELLMEQEAFAGMGMYEIIDQVVNKRMRLSVEALEGIDKKVKELVQSCMSYKPEDRPTAEKVCQVLQSTIKKSSF